MDSEEIHANTKGLTIMDWLFNGLPIHVLLVHFVVVVVPLAALCLVASAAWLAARRRLGIVTPLVAIAALVSIPLATEAGDALEEQVSESALSEIHGHLGNDLLPWVIALVVVAVAQWCWFTFFEGTGRFSALIASRPARITMVTILIVAALVVAVGSVVMTVIIGESGARAVWESRLN